MTKRERIKQELKNLAELRRLLRAEFEEDDVVVDQWDINTAMTTLKWVLCSRNNVPPAFGISSSVISEEENAGEEPPQALMDFLKRQFEQCGHWPLDRN